MSNPYAPKLYAGPEVRWWSVFRQQWYVATTVDSIPDEEYAAMSRESREAVIRHLDGVDVVRP